MARPTLVGLATTAVSLVLAPTVDGRGSAISIVAQASIATYVAGKVIGTVSEGDARGGGRALLGCAPPRRGSTSPPVCRHPAVVVLMVSTTDAAREDLWSAAEDEDSSTSRTA